MSGIETLKRVIASFKWRITLEGKVVRKSIYLIEVPHLSLNQKVQNIHKGALKSIHNMIKY